MQSSFITRLNTNPFWQSVCALCIGAVSFWIVVGLNPLHISNLQWLAGMDPAQHQLGWEFFRNSPWSLPLGLNPNYGLEISSSIVFTDSIPLLAIFFKSISTLLPTQFQYFGLWILTCFLLQALFSWKLAQLITDQFWLKFGICVLLGCFSLPMLKRLGLHAALMGHFLILASIYLNLRRTSQYRIMWWAILLVSSTLINFYLLILVSALWIANGCDQYLQHRNNTQRKILFEFFGLIAVIFGAAWLAGYILPNAPAAGAEGFGQYKLNLLSILNPHRWSYLIPTIKHPQDLEEGFNFLGLGMLFLLPFAAAKIRSQKAYWQHAIQNHLFYFLLLLLLTLFSLSNIVSIGNYTFTYYWPQWLIDKAAILRSSGRIFWPVFYTLNLFILALVVRGYSYKKSFTLLVVACCLQVIDSSAGWLSIRKQLNRSIDQARLSELSNPFWDSAATHYTKIKVFPLKSSQSQLYWYQLSHLAAHHHIATNAVYLGRPANPEAVNQANTQFELEKLSGQYQPQTLYILDEWKNNPAAITPKIDPKKDLLAQINGLTVLAPNWKTCSECAQVAPELEIASLAPLTHLHEPIMFSKTGSGNIFLQQLGFVERGYGWSFPEAWGVWSDGVYANLALPLPKKPAQFLQIQAKGLISKLHPTTELLIEISHSEKMRFTLKSSEINTLTIPIPKSLRYPQFLELKFHFLNPARPVDIGMPGNDQRTLGIGLISATFLP